MLKLALYGEEILRKKASPVEKITFYDNKLIEEMIAFMYKQQGIGLSAPQVFCDKQIFVVDGAGLKISDTPLVAINPRIKNLKKYLVAEEGCLSVPGIQAKVKRAGSLKLEAYDIKMRKFEIQAEGLLAKVIQHEVDHLNGILFVDRLSFLEKLKIRKKLKAI